MSETIGAPPLAQIVSECADAIARAAGVLAQGDVADTAVAHHTGLDDVGEQVDEGGDRAVDA
ncbi:hypothetical protein HR12_25275, partial [Microbacterium sp. SUBG005]